ncbi:c-type cytochrome [Paraburkholderia sacchari]|uniref:c-type cytochrome n=1 Tax=Paraburkholderia sacchari TaxID=159450 RepID=UPI00054361F7|nr:cytochrome c [Paraburkholderia sacchari]NLP65432.1 cytochrome c [Paraburkholderia sacchari]
MRAWAAWVTISFAGAVATGVVAAKSPGSVAENTVEVSLPTGNPFPQGPGSDLANAHCLICHSAGMVMRQPPLTFDDWKAEVTKMRAVYGAPLPPESIEDIARYLVTINGKR